MIEAEWRFAIKSAPAALEGLQFIKATSQIDIYYDTSDYALLRRGGYLRVRNDKRMDFKGDFSFDAAIQHDFCNEANFDLKDIPQKSDEINRLLRMYGIPAAGAYEAVGDLLKQNSLQVLATIGKNRRVYRFDDDTIIALDDVEDIGLFMEAETMVPDDTGKEEIYELKNKMRANLTERGVLQPDMEQVKIGYVEFYLMKHNRAAYNSGLFK